MFNPSERNVWVNKISLNIFGKKVNQLNPEFMWPLFINKNCPYNFRPSILLTLPTTKSLYYFKAVYCGITFQIVTKKQKLWQYLKIKIGRQNAQLHL